MSTFSQKKPDTRNNQPWSLPDGFLFDEEDAWLANSLHWFKDKHGAIVSGGGHVYFHRIVMKAPRGTYVDHINHNSSDNRKINLRLVTPAENSANMSLRCDNKSGYRGVYKVIKKNCVLTRPWFARAHTKGKQINIGYFDNPEEAGKAAYEWRMKHMPGATN